jgi:DNA-binding MarR family transcriptional regulator/RimJ/RimL family protein N-acetyltransferase
MTDAIDRIRAFNRAHTSRLRLLDRSYLGSGLGLAEARLLWEIVRAETAPTARALALALGLDEGQASRSVTRLEARGLVERRPDPQDRRRAALRPTPAGRDLLARLEERSREATGAALSHLDPAGIDRLAEAMEAVTRLAEGRAPEVELGDLAPGDAGWIVMQHGALYARDEGFDADFEALVAEIVAGFLRDRDPARERGWIARADGLRTGSVLVVDGGGGAAKLRLLLLVPEARGTGLGRRMLREAMGWARAAGYDRMTLWTHESHRAACALYAAEGFAVTASNPARSFGRDVVEQEWARPL